MGPGNATCAITDKEKEETTGPPQEQKADVEAGEKKLRERVASVLQLFQRDKRLASEQQDRTSFSLDELFDQLQDQIVHLLQQVDDGKMVLRAEKEKANEEHNKLNADLQRQIHASESYHRNWRESEGKIEGLQQRIQSQDFEAKKLRDSKQELEERVRQLSNEKLEAVAALDEAERERRDIREAGARLAAETRDEFLKAVMTPIYQAVVSAATEAAGRFALVRMAVQESEAGNETEMERTSRDFLKPLLSGHESDRFREFLEAGTGTVDGADRLLRRVVSQLRPFPASVNHGLIDECLARELQLDAGDVRASVELLRGAKVTIPEAYQDCFDAHGTESSSVYQIVRPGWVVGRAVLLPAKVEAVDQ